MNATITITDRGVTVETGSRIVASNLHAASASNLHRRYGEGVHVVPIEEAERAAGRSYRD